MALVQGFFHCRHRMPRSFRRWCKDQEQLGEITALDVADAAHAGDPVALEIFGIASRFLGNGLAVLVDVLNPELIVIGSAFARQRDLLWPMAEHALRNEALSESLAVCRVVLAELDESIGDYASLSVAVSRAGSL